ncbi:hypothetical protein [Serratia marcescens]|uniref:Uncharacterized protein n=1 Tax=Serratia marcescens TaxID=615 RepID=A0ABD5IDN7_SERMA|nr:hypothetical protein [Serratia marcescens]MDX7081871.1 hypothetical protein [Serratia marcescens]
MSHILASGFAEAIKRATVISEVGTRDDKFAAIAIFSISNGKYISRTAQTNLERLAQDPDKEVAEYAKHVLASVNLMP